MPAHKTIKANPPIPGHELVAEGHVNRRINWATEDFMPADDPASWFGGCRCGAKPDDIADISVNAMKRWHREHKAQLREAAS